MSALRRGAPIPSDTYISTQLHTTTTTTTTNLPTPTTLVVPTLYPPHDHHPTGEFSTITVSDSLVSDCSTGFSFDYDIHIEGGGFDLDACSANITGTTFKRCDAGMGGVFGMGGGLHEFDLGLLCMRICPLSDPGLEISIN